MQNQMINVLPLLSSILSLFTALAVAFIGVRNSKSIEASKIKASYLNYAFQKLMDEYMKYDPLVNLNGVESDTYIRRLEAKFHECRSLIIRISPLMDPQVLEPIRKLELQQVEIIRNEHNAKLEGREPVSVNADDYAKILTSYLNLGHSIMQSQLASFRGRLQENE